MYVIIVHYTQLYLQIFNLKKYIFFNSTQTQSIILF